MSLKHYDTIPVELADGTEVDVYNWVNLREVKESVVRPNMSETWPQVEIGAGDSRRTPEAVTEWLADRLWGEFDIDVEEHGIDIVDIESDEVTRL